MSDFPAIRFSHFRGEDGWNICRSLGGGWWQPIQYLAVPTAPKPVVEVVEGQMVLLGIGDFWFDVPPTKKPTHWPIDFPLYTSYQVGWWSVISPDGVNIQGIKYCQGDRPREKGPFFPAWSSGDEWWPEAPKK